MNRAVLTGVLGAALLAGACGSRDETTENRQQPAETAATTTVPADDGWVTTKVEAQFFASPDVKARNIDVSTNGGVVTLSGQVDSDAVRQQALALARGIEGVRDVRDQLRVAPVASAGAAATPTRTTGTATPDTTTGERTRDAAGGETDIARTIESGWTTTKIQAKYFTDADVKGRNIDVTTRDGVVTLSGEVENEAARQKAVQIARQTEGVRDVQDRLRVASSADSGGAAAGAGTDAARPTDEQLVSRVQSKFYQAEDLRTSTIDVKASESVVTLAGTVASESRRRQALSLARNANGVSAVRDELRVDQAAAATAEPAAQMPTGVAARTDLGDGWITTKIQAQFYLDPDIKGRNVEVTTKNGVVTLTGTVDNDIMRQQALAIAKDTDDVTRVVDRLTVGARGAAR